MNANKKTIVLSAFILSLFILFNGLQANAGLYKYLAKRGTPFNKCNQERRNFAAEHGVFNYDCSAKKNTELLNHLNLDDSQLGFSVATGFQKTLRTSMTASQTTVPVSSMTTKDGIPLTMSVLGPKVYLDLEPGATKEEIVVCTGISSNDFTGCTRGLAFSGTSENASTTLQQTHNSGSIVVMSNVHYVYENLIDRDTSEDVTGTKRFISDIKIGQGTVDTHKYIYADNGTANLPNLRYNVSTTAWQFSNDGTSFVNITSTQAGGLSAGRGLSINGFTMNINGQAATGTTALGFTTFNSLQTLTVSSTFPNGLLINADGLAVSTSTPHTWTASTSWNGNTHNGVTMQFSTSTNATSTNFSAITASTTVLNAGTVSTTALFVSSTNIGTILGNSTTNALNAHFHPSSSAWGIIVKPVNDTTDTVVNHGLGVVPSSISFFALGSCLANNLCVGFGYATSTVVASQVAISAGITGTTVSQLNTINAAILLRDSAGTNEATGQVSAMTSQTFTVAWTANANAGSSRLIIWNAQK